MFSGSVPEEKTLFGKNSQTIALREKRYNTEFFALFSCTWTEYRDLQSNSLYSVQNTGKYGLENSVFGHFLCSVENC